METKPPIPAEEWEWYPHPQHLIVAHDCRFWLATRVGNLLVSTVGEWVFPRSLLNTVTSALGKELGQLAPSDTGEFEPIGFGRTYETMVFELVPGETQEHCGCPVIAHFNHLMMFGSNDAKAARYGHHETCRGIAAHRLCQRPDA